ncbi:MAG: hypothetical protein Q9180_001871 [Flavoplaca navasiana]
MTQPRQSPQGPIEDTNERALVELHRSSEQQSPSCSIHLSFLCRPCSFFLFLIRAMEPGDVFVDQVIQHAMNTFRTGLVSVRHDQTSRTFNETLDDLLRESLFQWFSANMAMDAQNFGPVEHGHIEPMVEALRPRLAMQVMEYQSRQNALAYMTTQSSLRQRRGEGLQSDTPSAEPYSTSRSGLAFEGHHRRESDRLITPPTELFPTSSSLEIDGQHRQDFGRRISPAQPPAEPYPTAPSITDIEGQQTKSPDRLGLIRVATFIATCCGTHISPDLVQVARSVVQSATTFLSPLSFFGWLVFSFGLLVWRFKAAVVPGIFRIGFYLFDRSILVPICQQAHNYALDICYPVCAVAAQLQYPMLACTSQYFRQTASERSPVLQPKQLRFSRLAANSIASQFQSLEIRFDDSTYEGFESTAAGYDDLSSDIELLSRDTGLFFHIFTASKAQTNETLRVDVLQTYPLLNSILGFLWLSDGKRTEDAAFNAHVNTVRPQLDIVLTAASRVQQKFLMVQSQEARDANQLHSAKDSTQILHCQANRDRPFLEYLRGIQTSRINSTRITGQSIDLLKIAHAKAIDASRSSARSFGDAFAKFTSLANVLQQHEMWRGSRRDKPRKVYLSLMHSSMQEAKDALWDWEREDRRHEEFLFKSPTDRLSQLYREYADEEIR